MDAIINTPDLYLELLKSSAPPLSRASGNLTMYQFFELMFHVLGIDKPNLVFAPAYPQYLIPQTPEHLKTMENPTDLFRDTVSYMVTREEPGSVGGNKQPFGGTREVNPRFRETRKTSDLGSENVYGQWFDALVQFDLWTLTNWEAERLVTWVKRFMTTHRMFFKDMGLSEVLFWWRGRDEVSSRLHNNLHLRSIVYFVRTEEISLEEEYNLKELKVQINNLNG